MSLLCKTYFPPHHHKYFKKMPAKAEYDISIKLIDFFMSLVGFGLPKTKSLRRFMNFCMTICFSTSFLALAITGMDTYYSFKEGIIADMAYAILISLVAILTTVKITLAGLQRADYEKLLLLARNHLWTRSWTEYGEKILDNCKYQARWYFLFYLMMAHATGAAFITDPIIRNMQSNSSDACDRYLPFQIRLNLPVYETPYYEFFFALDTLVAWIAVLLYTSFDYYFVLLNIFIVGHFRILKRRFQSIYVMNQKQAGITAENEDIGMKIILKEFKNCVKQHQFLIWLVGEVESVYKVINLSTVVVLSFIICLLGYQCLLPGTISMYIKFSTFMIGCIFQLAAFSLSCHNIMVASIDIAHGTYESPWYLRNGSKLGRSMTRNSMIVIMKAQHPCYFTAGGFSVITLDAFKSICSTAFSYLTLIRQSTLKE